MLPYEAGESCEGRTAVDNLTVRTVFIIGPDKKVKLLFAYPMTTGRNFDEVLRVLDSLQLTAKHRVATPVNWHQGEDVIIAGAVSDDEANARRERGGDAAERVAVVDRRAALQGEQRHGPVDRAGVDEGEPRALGDEPGDGRHTPGPADVDDAVTIGDAGAAAQLVGHVAEFAIVAPAETAVVCVSVRTRRLLNVIDLLGGLERPGMHGPRRERDRVPPADLASARHRLQERRGQEHRRQQLRGFTPPPLTLKPFSRLNDAGGAGTQQLNAWLDDWRRAHPPTPGRGTRLK
jgi:hypothetical protein